MEFTIKTVNEPLFKQALQNMVDENGIQFPNAITINRDTSNGYTTYVLGVEFIHNLHKLNPKLIKKLQDIK